LLAILVKMHGRRVSKADLANEGWSDEPSDAAVFQAVYRLRKTLARYDQRSEYVATVPNRGYQFVAPVTEQALCAGYDVNGGAFAVYSRAMFQFQRGTKRSLSTAIALFRCALELDPQFALAYVGMAHAELCMGVELLADKTCCRERAFDACRNALNIDPLCADAYAIIAEIHAFFDADPDGAQQAIHKALCLNPSSSRVRTAAFWTFLTANDLTRALGYVSEALAADPSSNHFILLLGIGLYYQQRFDDAHARFIDANLFNPADAMTLFYDARTLCCLGDYSAAHKRLAQKSAADRNARVDALRAYVSAQRGEHETALRLLDGLSARMPRDDVALALGLTAVGRVAEAANHARAAIASKQTGCYVIGLDPLFEPVRHYMA
jgi:tetratricopeptide (TPR) repeat protein